MNSLRIVVCLILAAGIIDFRASAEELPAHTLAQISAIMEDKAARTPSQHKTDSQLLYAAKEHAGLTIAGAPFHRAALTPNPVGKVLVDVDATISDDLKAAIVNLGGRVVSSVAELNFLRAAMPIDNVDILAARADVKFVSSANIAETEPVHNPRAGNAAVAVRGLVAPRIGSINSEGDACHQADAARTKFSVDGTGVKVGVMSDGVDSLITAQGTADLGTVTVIPGQAGVGDEGTAMLEIVHDLAPGAALYYALGGGSTGSAAQMAANIRALRDAGCTIIVDDITYNNESPFQDGLIAKAVADVSGTGVLYFSSAANSGNLAHGTSGTWEGDFKDSGQVFTVSGKAAGAVHSFGADVIDFCSDTSNAHGGVAKVGLFWSDPLGASTNDYDLLVTDAARNVIRSSTTTQNGTQDPLEFVGTLNKGEGVAIIKSSGAACFLHIDTFRGALSIGTTGSTRGHNASGAVNAFCVAATDVGNSTPNPFTGGTKNPVETFSSDGPRRIFYNTDGSAITAGNFLSTGGLLLQKPDLTAADGVKTTLPASTGLNPFFGTSAAAPHAAALTALLRSLKPTLTAAQVRTALTSASLDIEGTGTDVTSGSGIVMALALLGGTSAAGGVTTTASANLQTPFNAAVQTVTLTATVKNTGITVNEGTVTFQVKSATTNVGLAVTTATVAGGAISAPYILPAGQPAGSYTISAVYNGTTNLAGSSDITHTLTILPVPVFSSAPTATPNPSTVGQTVQLNAAATGSTALTYAWDFGDGTTGATASISHVFSPAGTFTVKVTATDALKLSTSANLTMTAKPATTGIGVLTGEIDSDGDGFSDAVELAAGSDPLNAGSTPAGSGTISKGVLTPGKLGISKKQTLSFTGAVAIPAGFIATDAVVVADVGGALQGFTLDKHGSDKQGKSSFKLMLKSQKGQVIAQRAKFKLVLDGVPATVTPASPLQLVINNTVFVK